MPWETRGDKERQSLVISAQHSDTPWETKGDKGRQSKVIAARHPDMPWETRGDKERQSTIISAEHPDTPWDKMGHLSPATRHAMGDKGRQGETIEQNHLSPASRHAMGDKGRQSKIISAQHPNTPWETRGGKGWESSWASIVSMQDLRTPQSKAVWGRMVRTFDSETPHQWVLVFPSFSPVSYTPRWQTKRTTETAKQA